MVLPIFWCCVTKGGLKEYGKERHASLFSWILEIVGPQAYKIDHEGVSPH